MQRLVVPNGILLPEVEKLLNEGATLTLKVKGNSMLPFIVGGRDSVVLAKAGSLQEGDMVLARLADRQYVLHRIVRLQGEEVTLMGDGNLHGTEHCRPADICGKVIRLQRNGRYIEVDAPSERRKAALWQRLRPVRRYLLAAYRRLN